MQFFRTSMKWHSKWETYDTGNVNLEFLYITENSSRISPSTFCVRSLSRMATGKSEESAGQGCLIFRHVVKYEVKRNREMKFLSSTLVEGSDTVSFTSPLPISPKILELTARITTCENTSCSGRECYCTKMLLEYHS